MEEDVDAENLPRGKAIERRTYVVAECGLYEEEGDVLVKGIRDTNEGGTISFDA